ncbi:hypothetical protein [Pseudaestuariivita rosea]|uniref:hypothetical protein n=1 Tax=Pseudaestuariivita rosea TaxID=2763263 RepID=UPI001ABB2397|nr:hypothetical protein [Pseudaestuariivita rosea]
MLKSLALPVWIWIALVGTPFAISIGQVLFKISSRSLTSMDAENLFKLALNPVFIAALVLYGGVTVVWVFVLRMVPLSIAYTFMALTFCIVPILSVWLLGETIGIRFIIGGTFILAGLLIINV